MIGNGFSVGCQKNIETFCLNREKISLKPTKNDHSKFLTKIKNDYKSKNSKGVLISTFFGFHDYPSNCSDLLMDGSGSIVRENVYDMVISHDHYDSSYMLFGYIWEDYNPKKLECMYWLDGGTTVPHHEGGHDRCKDANKEMGNGKEMCNTTCNANKVVNCSAQNMFEWPDEWRPKCKAARTEGFWDDNIYNCRVSQDGDSCEKGEKCADNKRHSGVCTKPADESCPLETDSDYNATLPPSQSSLSVNNCVNAIFDYRKSNSPPRGQQLFYNEAVILRCVSSEVPGYARAPLHALKLCNAIQELKKIKQNIPSGLILYITDFMCKPNHIRYIYNMIDLIFNNITGDSPVIIAEIEVYDPDKRKNIIDEKTGDPIKNNYNFKLINFIDVVNVNKLKHYVAKHCGDLNRLPPLGYKCNLPKDGKLPGDGGTGGACELVKKEQQADFPTKDNCEGICKCKKCKNLDNLNSTLGGNCSVISKEKCNETHIMNMNQNNKMDSDFIQCKLVDNICTNEGPCCR